MKLNEISRTAVTTWCPLPAYSNYIAAGSIAGSLEDFSSELKLEIFTTDPASCTHKSISDTEDTLIGKVTLADRFDRLAWGRPNSDYELGIIAGSMIDGSITLYDASKIVGNQGEESTNAIVSTLEKHTGSVKGLEFNPSQTNLLASAGEDSNLYIWNLKNPSAPTPVTLGGKNPHQNQSISALAWNRVYEYILATTSYNGTSVVWDLKQKRPIVPFTNSQSKKRYSSLAWNPELSTQLVTASEDDNTPVIELWDLRKAYAPVREYVGHTKGILSVSWCPDDSNLLVSCGKDNRTLIWNPNSGEVLGELPTSNNWMYDVQWSKRPSILSTSSYDGKISIISLQDSSATADVGEYARDALGLESKPVIQKNVFKTAPKWLQRPAGAVFGFGGRLVTFGKDAKAGKTVTVYSVGSEPETSERALELENAQKSKQLEEYCEKKARTDSDVWSVMKVLFASDRSSTLLKYLGLDKNVVSEQVQEKLSAEPLEDGTVSDAHITSKIDLDTSSVDELIRKSVLVQNYEDAVNIAIAAGRLADALILSTCGGADLWEKTRQTYFSLQDRKDMKIVASMLNNKFDNVVDEADLDNWKDALSVIASCQDSTLFKNLCNRLAIRLEEEKNDISAATLCYMLSGNVEKTVSIWVSSVVPSKKEDEEEEAEETVAPLSREDLLSLIEKVTIFKIATNTNDESLIQSQPALARFYAQYAQILSLQGSNLLPVALHYLNMGVATESEETAALRYRIYNSLSQPFGPSPRPPFQIKELAKQQQPRQVGPLAGRAPQPTSATVSGLRPIQPTGTFVQPISSVPMGVPPQHTNTGFPPMNAPYGSSPAMTNVPTMGPPPTNQPTVSGGVSPMGGLNVPYSAVPPTGFRQPIQQVSQQQLPPTTSGGFMQPSFSPQPSQQFGMPSFGAPPTTGSVGTPTFTQPPMNPISPPPVSQPPISEPPTTSVSEKAESVSSPSSSGTPVSDVDLSNAFNTLQASSEKIFSGEVSAVDKTKKRMIENGLSTLSKLMNEGRIGVGLGHDLAALANAIDSNDIKHANNVVQKITKEHWEQSKDFIKGIKFLVSLIKQK